MRPHVLSLDQRRPPLSAFAWRSALNRMTAAFTLRRQRGHLAALDPHLLRDVGLTADAAATEAARPMWDVPDHWRAHHRRA